MRKIKLQNQANEKKKTKQFLVGAILILVMFFSVLGYSFSGKQNPDDGNKIIYNGIEFVNQNGFWVIDNAFIFRYNPLEVEEIFSEVNLLTDYVNKPLYIYSENTEASLEIQTNFNQIAERMQLACLNEEDCGGDYPIKTCEDNFILIQEGEENKIIQDENCVFIQGPKEDLTKLTDEFLFKILGIRGQ